MKLTMTWTSGEAEEASAPAGDVAAVIVVDAVDVEGGGGR